MAAATGATSASGDATVPPAAAAAAAVAADEADVSIAGGGGAVSEGDANVAAADASSSTATTTTTTTATPAGAAAGGSEVARPTSGTATERGVGGVKEGTSEDSGGTVAAAAAAPPSAPAPAPAPAPASAAAPPSARGGGSGAVSAPPDLPAPPRVRSALRRRLVVRDRREVGAWRAVTAAQVGAARSQATLLQEKRKAEVEVMHLTRHNRALHRRLTLRGAGGDTADGGAGDGGASVSSSEAGGDGGNDGEDAAAVAAAAAAALLEGAALDEEVARLESEVLTLRAELTASRKRTTDISQRVIDLTDTIRAMEDELAAKDSEISGGAVALRHAHQVRKMLEDDLDDRELTTQVLQEELRALQAELVNKESDERRLRSDNEVLLQQLLAKAEKDAEKLNAANEMYDEMAEARAQAERERAAEREGARAAERHQSTGGVGLSILERLTGAAASLAGDGHSGSAAAAAAAGVAAEDAVLSGAAQIGATLPTEGKRLVEAHEDECQHVVFSPASGSTLATAGADRTVRLWDTRSCLRTSRPTPRATLTGHTLGVLCVDFSPHDDLVVSASADKTVRVWSARGQGRHKHTLTGHVAKVMSAHFAGGDSGRVVSGGHDRSIKVWDLAKGYCTRTIFCYSACNSVSLSRDGRMAVSGHFDNSVRFWDTKSGDAVAEVTDVHTSQVTSCAFNPTDDRHVLTNSRDHTMCIIDTRTHRVIRTLSAPSYRNGINWNHATWSPDAQFIVAGSADGGLHVWDARTGDLADNMPLHVGTTTDTRSALLTCVAWSVEGSPVAAADKSGHIRLFA